MMLPSDDPNVEFSARGFEFLKVGEVEIHQSSEVNFDYDDALDRPGSSALWVNFPDRINREEALAVGEYLMRWATTGSFLRGRDEQAPCNV